MQDNRSLIDNIVKAFDSNDEQAVQALVSDDIEWQMGSYTYKGRNGISQYFRDSDGVSLVSARRRHIIVDGDQAAVDGNGTYRMADGKTFTINYCDVYEIAEGRVKRIFSYIVDEKQNEAPGNT